MQVRPGCFVAIRTGAVAVAGAAAMTVVAGCGGGPTPADLESPSPVAVGTTEPRAQLSARVAAAKDRHFVAGYTLTPPGGGKPRAVIVTVAADDTWRVDIQGGALSGAADVAIVGRADGTYQCALAGAADSGCVRVAEPGAKLPAAIDPRIPYAFTSWLDVLTDRQLAVSVAPAAPLAGASGTCFSVEPVAVSLLSPIDPGVFCYADDGTFTGAKAAFGTLILTGAPIAGPPTVLLPGRAVTRAALPLSAPPPPPPPPTTAAPPITPGPGGATGPGAGTTKPSVKPSVKPTAKTSTKPAPTPPKKATPTVTAHPLP